MKLDEYPREVVLKDGSTIVLRPMVEADEGALLEFFKGLSDTDRLYLRHDVTNPEVVRLWARNIDYERVLPILAVADGTVVGDATLHRNPFSWMRHVGSIRIVVGTDYRKKGLARILAAEIFQLALTAKLEKLVAEMLTEQNDARRVFSRLGFKEEATLKDHVMDVANKKHDMLIMTNDVNTLWQKWVEFSDSVSGSWHMED